MTASVLAGLMMINAAAFGAVADHSAALTKEVKTLQAKIDSGAKSDDAIDVFSKSIVDQNISLADVEKFVRARFTEAEYATFESQINSALRGIDPATLSQQEMADIVARALAGVRSEGLYWSGCAQFWTGAAVIAAAVVAGIFAIVKSKSEASVKKDWDTKISDTTGAYNASIDMTRNWQTGIPNAEAAYQQDMNNLQQSFNYYYQMYQQAQTQQEQQQYSQYLQQIQQQYQNDVNAVAALQALFDKYTADPTLAEPDAVALEQARDAALADLANQEAAALANVPGNQALAKKLGIGAGIGGAIGAALIVHGIHDGVHCGG
jgi:hypothetical protein